MLGAFVVAVLAGEPAVRAQEPGLLTVRIATPGNDGNALAFYAQALGLFKKYGIDPQIQVIRAGGGATIIAGIAGNSLDVGESDLIAIATAREHGFRYGCSRPRTCFAPAI